MRTLEQLTTIPERYPIACQWELTCRCNLRCIMCYTDCFNRPDKIQNELPTEEILRIMDELADAGCLELCLTGGEPLARPDFFDIYTRAKQSGFLVTIFTNGTLITEAVADRLAALPPHRIEISFHGLTERTFEAITQGKGSYQRCLRAIDLLRERNLPLVLKSTAMTVNRGEILAIKRLVSELGPVEYRLGEELRGTLDGSDAPRQLTIPEADWLLIKQQDPDLWTETCRNESKEPAPCTSGMRRFHIDAYGRLQLCSGNRRMSYDLRKGSFKTGFYEALPTFACDYKADRANPLIQVGAVHA